MANIEKRTSQDGNVSYRVKIRLKGFPTQSATFDRLADAKKYIQQTEAAIREGRYFQTQESKKHTLKEAINRYIADVLPTKPKNTIAQGGQLNWWRETLGDYSLADITPARIVQCRDQLSKTLSPRGKLRTPATVNRYLAVLSHLFTIALKEWGWVEDNPLRKVSKPQEPRGRVRFLSDEERSRLLGECKKSESRYLYPAVVLALSTGGRRMEILGLQFKNVDLKRKVIILHETKNGERRILPLAGHALDLMEQLFKVRHYNCDLVFPGKDFKKPVDLRTPFETALKRSEISDFKWHDLRNSCASYLAMNGASLAEIAEVLGHKTLSMVKRYSHLSDAHTSKVVARMNEAIFG